MVIIAVLSIIGATFARIITFECRHAMWQRQWVQTFYIAEAGIARGWNDLKGRIDGPDRLNDILVGADGIPNTGDDGLLGFGASVNFGGGSYSVVVADNDDGDGDDFSDSDGIAKIVSTGTMGKIERTINIMFAISSPFVLNHAIITGGDFKISGNSTIRGNCGSVYTDGNLTISGNPYVSQDVMASGSVNISGNPNIGGEVLSGAPPISIPPIAPEFYRANADYELRDNGDVFDVSSQTLIPSPDEFNGWRWSENKWSFSGNTGVNGTYYIEGDAKVSGNPGTLTDPWRVTIIATGSIQISGNPTMQPETTDLLFVAGGDIKISGNPNQSYEGAMLAHEQVMITGNPSLEGVILAEDAANISSVVTENRVSGNMTIEYNGDLAPPLPEVFNGQLRPLSWRCR